MNNALWSPRGARAGERNRATGYTTGRSAYNAILMVQRCNATTARLGYLEVGRDSLHKSLSVTALSTGRMWTFCMIKRLRYANRHSDTALLEAVLCGRQVRVPRGIMVS